MARNAYEIRYDTLCLARDILSEHSHIMTDRIKDGGVTVEVAPKPYTTEDVLKEAEKLYAFVAKGKDGE